MELTHRQIEKIAERVAAKVVDEVVRQVLEGLDEATDEVIGLKEACERFDIGEKWLREHAPQMGGIMLAHKWRFSTRQLTAAVRSSYANGLASLGKYSR